MSKINHFKGVLFDLDGTLLDTIGDITYAINSALIVVGAEPITTSQCKGLVGRGLKNALKGAFELRNKKITPSQLEELVPQMLESYHRHPYRHTHPYEGVEALLYDLVKGGVALGVLSNKADSLVQPIIRGVLPSHPFVFIRGDKEGWPSKPEPDGVYAFSEAVGVPVDQLLLVGDSEVDYYTAEAAQVDVAIATWGFRSRERLLEAGCRNLYSSVEELRKEVFPWL